MSDGSLLLSSILEAGASSALREVGVDLFVGAEVEQYNFITRHYRRYGQLPDITTVEAHFNTRLPDAVENTSFYMSRVHDRKLYNEVRAPFGSLRDALRDNDMPAARVAIDSLKTASRVINPNNDLRTLSEAGVDVLRNYDIAHRCPGVSGIPSGWDSFDTMTGGYQNGDLISIVARMGMGKTYLLLIQAYRAWLSGKNVLFVTMEMTIPQIARRLFAVDAGINPNYVRKGALSTHTLPRFTNHVNRVVNDTQLGGRFNLYAGSFNKRVSDVENVIHEVEPDLVCIDGLYLMHPSEARKMNKIERISEVLDEVKRVTITCDRPVVATSQLNRGAGKKGKDGSMETIGYSDAFGTHSSIVVGVKEGEPPYQGTRRVLDVMKGREGETGEYPVNYMFTPVNFDEVAAESDDERAARLQTGGSLDWQA